jgi:hypothetical protein
MEVLKKKERQYETQFTTKIDDGFLSFLLEFEILILARSFLISEIFER